MRLETFDLNAHFNNLPFPVTLTGYIQENSEEIAPNRRRPAIVVCPGGGYVHRSARENEPIALALLARGYQVFVLNYSVNVAYPAQLLEAAAAIALIRKRADEFFVIPNAISVLGFSAGGHVAATIGTLWHEAVISETLSIDNADARPDAMVLCYPVITGGEKAHAGSLDIVSGGDLALRSKLSLETAVRADTPPTFLWHTMTDDCVPVENSLFFANALTQHGIEYEMHIFPHGPHGLSLATQETNSPHVNRIYPHISQWFDLCDNFLKTKFAVCD